MAVGKGRIKASSMMSKVIVLLIIAIVVMGGLTLLKTFETESVSPEEDTIKTLTDYVNEVPDNLDARLKLAYAYQKQSKWDEAREIYEGVIKVDPANQAAMYNLAVIALENKDYKDAEKKLKELLAKHPTHLLGLSAISDMYLEVKKPDLAIQYIDKALGERPDIIDFRLTKAKALEMKGQKEKAKAEYKAVLKYVPDEPRAIESLAKLK